MPQSTKYKTEEDDGTQRLVIHNCSPDDSGEYTIEARNDAGLATCSSTLSLQEDTVLPKFIQKLHDITLPPGNRLKMTATFVGTPEPEITWLLDGDTLSPMTGIDVLTEEGTSSVVIDSLQPEDAGQYKCIARSNVGKATTSCVLTIGDAASFPVSPNDNLAGEMPVEKVDSEPRAPRFVKQVSNIQVFDNDEVIMEVIVDGTPTPRIEWQFSGKPLATSDSVTTESDGSVHRLV